ncbi:MAG: hypothetical protein H7X97_02495 [Opitutaceae bacterium]|nr:hypothetical protein [Verrucomicrobiales bacterium]
MKFISTWIGAACLVIGSSGPVVAWDYEGHRIVNQIALSSLPTNFPSFVLTPAARERIAFLAGEPDRWRNSTDLPLKHFNGPDHYIDLEELADVGLSVTNLSHFRYEFMAQLAVGRDRHATNLPAIDPAKNLDKTRELVGFLPWAITEQYAKLKSAFSYLKAFEENGTPEEIANAQENIVSIMGVMGHYVGDATQPLHTTKHFNGWVGENPRGYTTNRSFHSWIDGGYNLKTGLAFDGFSSKIKPAKMLWPGNPAARHDDVFPEAMEFILEQFRLVETLYRLEKDGRLSGDGENGLKGVEFIRGQMLKAGQKLGDFWWSAYRQAGPDNYLKARLIERKYGKGGKPPSGQP